MSSREKMLLKIAARLLRVAGERHGSMCCAITGKFDCGYKKELCSLRCEYATHMSVADGLDQMNELVERMDL